MGWDCSSSDCPSLESTWTAGALHLAQLRVKGSPSGRWKRVSHWSPGSLVFSWSFPEACGRVSEEEKESSLGSPRNIKANKAQFAPSKT